MKHYVCTGGCQGVAESPGTCQDEKCAKHGLLLTECDCEDGKHEETYTKEKQDK